MNQAWPGTLFVIVLGGFLTVLQFLPFINITSLGGRGALSDPQTSVVNAKDGEATDPWKGVPPLEDVGRPHAPSLLSRLRAGATDPRLPLLLLIALVGMFPGSWLCGGQIWYLNSVLHGQRPLLADFWDHANRSVWRMFGAVFVVTLVTVLVGLLMLVFLVKLRAAQPLGWFRDFFRIVLAVSLVVWGIGLFIRLFLWSVAFVVDDLSLSQSVRASFHLTRGRSWKMLRVLGVLLLFSFVISIPASLVLWIVRHLLGADAVLGKLTAVFVNLALNGYLASVFVASFLHFYHNAKRTDGMPS